MNDIDLDIFIPTAKNPKHLNTLVGQIMGALYCGLNTRVTIGMKGEYPELMNILSPKQIERMRFYKDVPEGDPDKSDEIHPAHPAIRHMLENIEWVDWVRILCDDDLTPSWSYQHMWEARADAYMVMGQGLGVSREKHYDLTAWKLGRSIQFCHLSANLTLFNMRMLEKLPKPWWLMHRTADFDFVKRYTDNFKYKIIPSVVDVVAFAERENLGDDFNKHFSDFYGEIL